MAIHVNDINTKFILTVTDEATGSPVDISGALTKEIKFTQPNGVTWMRNALFVAGGVDGRLQYFFAAGELVIDGSWAAQVKVSLPGGTWHTNIVKFEVFPNLSGW